MSEGSAGCLPENLLSFCRALRSAAVPVGTAQLVEGLRAAAAVGVANRADWRTALRCALVSDPAHYPIFDEVFDQYFRASDLPDRSSVAVPDADEPISAAEVGSALHLADPTALSDEGDTDESAEGRAGYSALESFKERDFEAMSDAELTEAAELLRKMPIPSPGFPSRRFEHRQNSGRPDLRRSMRGMLRRDGELLELLRQRPRRRPLDIVLLCDISGSMSAYSRVFLHLAHVLTAQPGSVHSFVFGTRLTDVTRHLRQPDVDQALAGISKLVTDWHGGTRIAASLREFNQIWGRRLLARGAAVLLMTDGLERDTDTDLALQTARLRRTCRRLVWLNPMLRFADFRPLASGVKTMLPNVDAFLPAHNINSLSAVVQSLGSTFRDGAIGRQVVAASAALAGSTPGRNTRTIMSASASTFSS